MLLNLSRDDWAYTMFNLYIYWYLIYHHLNTLSLLHILFIPTYFLVLLSSQHPTPNTTIFWVQFLGVELYFGISETNLFIFRARSEDGMSVLLTTCYIQEIMFEVSHKLLSVVTKKTHIHDIVTLQNQPQQNLKNIMSKVNLI